MPRGPFYSTESLAAIFAKERRKRLNGRWNSNRVASLALERIGGFCHSLGSCNTGYAPNVQVGMPRRLASFAVGVAGIRRPFHALGAFGWLASFTSFQVPVRLVRGIDRTYSESCICHLCLDRSAARTVPLPLLLSVALTARAVRVAFCVAFCVGAVRPAIGRCSLYHVYLCPFSVDLCSPRLCQLEVHECSCPSGHLVV